MNEATFLALLETPLRKSYFRAAIALMRREGRAKEWNRRLDALP